MCFLPLFPPFALSFVVDRGTLNSVNPGRMSPHAPFSLRSTVFPPLQQRLAFASLPDLDLKHGCGGWHYLISYI